MATIGDVAILFKSYEEITGRESFQAQIQVANGDLDRIIGGYDFEREMQLRCGLNNCNQLHQRGYVIATKHGVETVCGNVCGARELGVDFTEMVARFTARVDEQKRRQTIQELQENAEASLAQCNALKRAVDAVYPALAEIRSELRRDTDINRSVELLIREGGRVRVVQQLTAAERELAVGTKQRANLQTIATIEGIHALRDYPKAANVVDELLKTTKELQTLDATSVKGRKLSEYTAKINGFPASLAFLNQFLEDASAFLTPHNFGSMGKIAKMGAVKEHKLAPILQKIIHRFY
ncbi:hypothetical protein [Achromobacter mucicolens]|uniref:hypothetical protein n=1 Tax=Achromobacter mucicolens TaxID=1389922 RepID=UPI00244CF9F9|nr:hypothetical protein [Achromobacter mucicolens]MDH1522552.1 hypothetical protein [Achromobacter mucicolens]